MVRLLRIPLLVVVLGADGCGGSDDTGGDASAGPEAPEQAASPDADAGSATTDAADESDRPQDTPSGEIDVASMPATGDAQFEVEVATCEFAAADAAQGAACSCSVGPTEIVVELQLSPGALLVQANNPDGDFFWWTSDKPASREDAGVGTVRVSC